MSGAGPVRADGSLVAGKVRRDRLRRSLQLPAELGGLDRVSRVMKVFGMVNSAPGFTRTPQVIDGCSQLLVVRVLAYCLALADPRPPEMLSGRDRTHGTPREIMTRSLTAAEDVCVRSGT